MLYKTRYVKKLGRKGEEGPIKKKSTKQIQTILNNETRSFGFTETLLLLNLYPFMLNGFFYQSFLNRSISNRRNVWLFIIIIIIITTFIEINVFYVNNVDPDQTPPSAASDLGLHCLSMSFLWSARH